jgi:hypothetical protein
MDEALITKPKATVVASLESTAKEALAQHGNCELALKKGTLRITDLGKGEIGIEGISTNDNPRFQFSVKGGQITYIVPANREDIRAEYRSERLFLSKLDGLIQRALDNNSISSLPYPKYADPTQSSLGQRVATSQPLSIQEEIAAAWNSVNRILTTPDGNTLRESVTGVDIERGRPHYNLHIRRRADPLTIELEMISTSYRRDVFLDDRVIVKPNSIVYHMADSDKPFKDERYALDQLKKWLSTLEKAASSPQDKPA